MSFEGWVKTELGEVYDFSSGLSKNAKEFGFGYPFLSFKTVFNNYFIPQNIDELANTTEREQEKYSIKKGDVFLTRTSETLDELGMSCVALKDYPTATFNGFTKRLRPKVMNVIDEKYAGYYFRSQKFRDSLTSMATISTRASLNNDILQRLQITLPPLKEQSEIGNVLYCLDSKIELNNQINKKLEEMAQTIFKSWFIDFEPFQDGEFEDSELGRIPKGWRVGRLDEVTSKFTTGLNPRKNFVLGQGDNFYVTIKNMGDNQVWLDDRCDKVTDEALIKINKRSDLQKGDLLFSGIGTIGRVYLLENTPDNWNISESIFTMRPNTLISSEVLYMVLLSNEMQEYAHQLASGSVQKGIRMADLKKYKLLIPPKNVIDNITDILRDIIMQIKSNQYQNKSLSSIRDTLLPKLMSGEIRVPIEEVR